MDWLLPAGTFVLGALVVAAINEVVARLLGGPRVEAAVADLALTRTRNPRHKSLPIADNLRLLLSDRSTKTISWGEQFMGEYGLDLSVLELLEAEQLTLRIQKDIEDIQSKLAAVSAQETVLAIGRNQQLIAMLVNALIRYSTEASPPPPTLAGKASVFPLVTRSATDDDGEPLEFVHLDIPGNPYPVVGAQSGHRATNEKVALLALALSRADADCIRKVLNFGSRYCTVSRSEATSLRSELERIKAQVSYLTVQLVLANRGDAPAFVATTLSVAVGDASAVLCERVEEYTGEAKPDIPVEITDRASRLRDWAPVVSNAVAKYQSIVRTVAIDPRQSLRMRFVSTVPVDQRVKEAAEAIRTGHAACTLTLTQYVPRRRSWMPRIGRFSRKLATVQRLKGGAT